jgi:hypothetical protein
MGELEPQRPGLGPQWLEAWAAAHPKRLPPAPATPMRRAPADEEPFLTDNVLVFRRHCPGSGEAAADATGWPV